MPCRAAGTRPTVESTEVRPPTQSSIGKRAMKWCCVGELIELRSVAGDGDGVFAEIQSRGFPGGLGFEHAVAGFRSAAGFGNDEHERLVEAVGGDLGEHRVHAGGVGVVEEEDRQAGVLADGLGDELRAERGAADADEQDLLEDATVGRRDLAGVDFHREVLEVGERAGDGLFQLRRGGEVGVAQPVVADHAAFVGVGDGTGFERLHVGEGALDFRFHAGGEIRADVHQ